MCLCKYASEPPALPWGRCLCVTWLLRVHPPLQALISVTPDEETYDEEDAAFCLEMLLRIVLENRCDLEEIRSRLTIRVHLPPMLRCLCLAEIECHACGRRCVTISITSASTPLRAASWWRGPWWGFSGSQSASCAEKTSALR